MLFTLLVSVLLLFVVSGVIGVVCCCVVVRGRVVLAGAVCDGCDLGC